MVGESSLLRGFHHELHVPHSNPQSSPGVSGMLRRHRLNPHVHPWLRRYIQSELVHSRFAMAAVAGILIPEASSCAAPCLDE